MAIQGLDRVALAFIGELHLDDGAAGTAPRCWIQLARTGKFQSNRYGKFSITKEDLAQMASNFHTVTPKAPTELPIDYDHLSMDPKKPGDGLAAGWLKDVELRNDGQELWGDVAWTPKAADAIRNLEYRFVSPSFVKDHTHKDGSKIGTTLLAAAITNHPFLEGMSAVSLFTDPILGASAKTFIGRAADVAMLLDEASSKEPAMPFADYKDFDDCVAKNGDKSNPQAYCGFIKSKVEASAGNIPDVKTLNAEWASLTKHLSEKDKSAAQEQVYSFMSWDECVRQNQDKDSPEGFCAYLKNRRDASQATGKVISLAEVGQRVMVAPGAAHTKDEVGGTFEIAQVVGDGDDAFVMLKDANGATHKWFRATELLPASVVPANPDVPNLQMPEPTGGSTAGDGTTVTGEAVKEPPAGTEPPADVVIEGQPKKPGAQTSQTVAKSEMAKPDVAKPEDEGAVGAEPQKETGEKSPGSVESATNSETSGAPDSSESAKKQARAAEALKQLLASLSGGAEHEGMTMVFKLRNDKNEEISVTAEQLQKAGVTIVGDGEVAIPKTDLAALQEKVTNLSSTVESLQATNLATAKLSREAELTRTLSNLSEGGFVTKPTRDALFEQFKDALDLTAFRALVATFTTPVVNLNTVHGSGAGTSDKSEGEVATDKLLSLSQKYVAERGMSMRQALLEAGKELASEVESYREQFATL